MKKKTFAAILNLYEFPLFFDRENFYDKCISFLYMQFKFKDIEGVNKEDLGFDSCLFDNGSIVAVLDNKEAVALTKKNFSTVDEVKKIVICVDRIETKDFLAFKIGKTAMQLFESIKDMKLFFSSIEKFFNRQEKCFKDTKSYLLKQKQTVKEQDVSQVQPQQRTIENMDFLSVSAKNMPERIKLVLSIEKAEAALIKEMLKRTKGKKIEAATKLGITERMIGYKIKKYGLG